MGHKEFNQLVQYHTANKQWSQEANPSRVAIESIRFTTTKKKKKALNSSLTAILGTSRSALFIQWLLAIYGGYFRELNLNQMKNPIPRFHPHI